MGRLATFFSLGFCTINCFEDARFFFRNREEKFFWFPKKSLVNCGKKYTPWKIFYSAKYGGKKRRKPRKVLARLATFFFFFLRISHYKLFSRCKIFLQKS